MKTFLPTLLVLSSLLSLVSCGQGGQSSASLQVSRGFAMTNPNFGGGLIIAGKNLTTGKTFSKGLTTSMSINLDLDKGAWLITATGWDGGSTSNVAFGGLPYCGKVTKVLSNDQETIDLSVTTAECASTFFAGAHPNMAGTSVKTLSLINTCNTFFNGAVVPGDTISSKIVAAGTATDGFCENIATDLQTKVESVKIFALNKDLKNILPTPGYSSNCIKRGSQLSKIDTGSTTPSNPYQTGSELRLPVGGIPFMIVTYRDNNCGEQVAQYPFKDGLASGDPEKFDHLVLSRTSNEIKLILPGNDMRRGYTPFQAIMPYFKRYNSGTPAKFLTEPGSLSYVFHGIISQNNIAVLDNQSSCSSVTYDGTLVTNATCAVVDGKAVVTWTAGATEGNGSFGVNGSSYAVYADNATFGRNRFDVQKLSMELLGYDGSDSISRFFELKNKDDEKYGALSIVRDMFSAHAAGGALGISNPANTFASECLAMTADKEIKVFNWEKMQEETYRVILTNSPSSTPTTFTCNTTDADESNCVANGEVFDKRMLIYDYRITATVPSFAMEFNCTSKIGKMETNSVEIEGIFKEESKQIVNWNTNDTSNLQYQRFERVVHNKQYRYASGWIQTQENRQMARVMKTDTDNYEAWTYNFHTHKNLLNTFDQGIDQIRFRTNSTTNVNYVRSSAGATNANPVYVFGDVTNATLLAQTPASQSGDNFFYPNSIYPQGSSGTSDSFNALSSDFTNANLINDGLSFTLGSLNSGTFTGSTFGSSFLTGP